MNGDPKFKVGDEVTVNFIEGTNPEDYPCGFVSGMKAYHGKKLTISKVYPGYRHTHYTLSFLADGYVYTLEGNNWNWSSPMFLESQNEL